jgi:CRP-like cAMP-binding protein
MIPAAMMMRKLESVTDLSDDDRTGVLGLPITVQEVGRGVDIVREGDRPSQCCLIVEGFACRYNVTSEGKRQIQSFHTPGDLPDLQSLHLKVLDHSLRTLTPSKLGFISHQSIHELCRRQPNVAAALWRDTLVDAAIFREWIVNVGRRDAHARIAHVLCEVFTRLKAVGLAEGNSFALPITQSELADATGLSHVHVNRTIQELRMAGLITLREGEVTILDMDGLRSAGDFDPIYLHLNMDKAA